MVPTFRFFSRMKKPILTLLFALSPSFAFALGAKLDLYDSAAKYSVVPSTRVRYCEQCARDKFAPYGWKTWVGYYSLKAYVQPVADITVVRESSEAFTMDYTPYIQRAVQESARLGGNILCLVTFKKNRYTFGFESVTFRAYKQVFESGNDPLVHFYDDRSVNEGLVTLEDVRRDVEYEEQLEQQQKKK